MKKIEYRVMEFQSKFYIQGKFHDIHIKYSIFSLLFWANPKEIDNGWNWHRVNTVGFKCRNYYRLGIHDPELQPFNSLEDAFDKIRIFQAEVLYYYPNK